MKKISIYLIFLLILSIQTFGYTIISDNEVRGKLASYEGAGTYDCFYVILNEAGTPASENGVRFEDKGDEPCSQYLDISCKGGDIWEVGKKPYCSNGYYIKKLVDCDINEYCLVPPLRDFYRSPGERVDTAYCKPIPNDFRAFIEPFVDPSKQMDITMLPNSDVLWGYEDPTHQIKSSLESCNNDRDIIKEDWGCTGPCVKIDYGIDACDVGIDYSYWKKLNFYSFLASDYPCSDPRVINNQLWDCYYKGGTSGATDNGGVPGQTIPPDDNGGTGTGGSGSGSGSGTGGTGGSSGGTTTTTTGKSLMEYTINIGGYAFPLIYLIIGLIVFIVIAKKK